MKVDIVVRHWMYMTVEDESVIHNGLGHVVMWILGVFYLDDGLLGFHDPEWLQGVLNVLIGLFRRIGLMENLTKSKMMTCQSGAIRLVMSEEVVGRISTGKGDTYRENLRRCLPCLYCGVKLTAGSMAAHLRHLNFTDL